MSPPGSADARRGLAGPPAACGGCGASAGEPSGDRGFPGVRCGPAPHRTPLTTWVAEFTGTGNKLLVEATERNGLDADSAADYLQVRSVSVERLVERIGSLDAELVEEIVAGIVIALDYQP